MTGDEEQAPSAKRSRSAGARVRLGAEASSSSAAQQQPDENRQGIVDSWPADVEIGCAKQDWDYAPRWNLEEAFEHYIAPAIRTHYAQT